MKTREPFLTDSREAAALFHKDEVRALNRRKVQVKKGSRSEGTWGLRVDFSTNYEDENRIVLLIDNNGAGHESAPGKKPQQNGKPAEKSLPPKLYLTRSGLKALKVPAENQSDCSLSMPA